MNSYVSRLARFFAILGGLALSTLIVMTCLSILGRSANSLLHSSYIQAVFPDLATALLATGIGPINGDFELVEAGMAFTLFAFLPLCQLHGAHASVDVLTSKLPLRINRLLRTLIESIFALVLILIAFKLFAGMESKRGSGQTTFLLQFPVWWGYVICLPGAMVAALVAVYVAFARLVELVTDKSVIPSEQET